MIYCSTNNIRHVSGNLGNMLMRMMSMMGMAKKYNTTWAVPEWQYAKYFENEIPQINDLSIDLTIKELSFHYTPEYYDTIDWSKNVDMCGFFQSPKYWDEKFVFKEMYLNELKDKYDVTNSPIAISVRRGNFIRHPCYYQIPPMYYLSALRYYFPKYPQRDVFIFSDDMEFCKKNYKFSNRTFFIQASDIEQLAVMTLCDDFIISNSTFSYMGAYLADKGTVVRPIKNFDGEFAKKNSEKDFWVKSWISFDGQKNIQNVV